MTPPSLEDELSRARAELARAHSRVNELQERTWAQRGALPLRLRLWRALPALFIGVGVGGMARYGWMSQHIVTDQQRHLVQPGMLTVPIFILLSGLYWFWRDKRDTTETSAALRLTLVPWLWLAFLLGAVVSFRVYWESA